MTKSSQKIENCTIGKQTIINDFVNLYGCIIGESCMVGTFVEIQKGAILGNNIKISSHSFICEGVTIQDNVFIGHHVVFTNDRYPSATSTVGVLKKDGEWKLEKTLIEKNVSIGSNVTILPGVKIGEGAIIGAGSVVTKDVKAFTVMIGNPAKKIRSLES